MQAANDHIGLEGKNNSKMFLSLLGMKLSEVTRNQKYGTEA